MTVRDHQAERLERIVSWANRVAILKGLWRPAEQQLHLRPSSTGIRLVDLSPDRPQLNRGRVGDPRRLEAQFAQRLADPVKAGPGRTTPEKVLQSWLLLDAYRHDSTMHALSPELRFVTDEQNLPDEDKAKVCDLLALRTTAAGQVPVVIELKTEREMTRLIEQLAFADLVDAHARAFERLCSALRGAEVSFTGSCERWLVWPAAEGHRVDPREGELGAMGIRVVTYEQSGAGFSLRVGAEPPS